MDNTGIFSPPQAAAHAIRRWIREGRLTAGERLPSVRALERNLGASRYSVCEAIRLLEHEGAVRKADGRYVISRPVTPHESLVHIHHMVILADAGQIDTPNMLIPGFDRAIEISAMLSLRQLQYNVHIADPETVREPSEYEHLVSHIRPHGVIAFHHTAIREPDFKVLETLRADGIPVVVYGNDDQFGEYDTLESDHYTGAMSLSRYLVDRGCRRILPFMHIDLESSSPPKWFSDRMAGYEQTCHDAGIRVIPPMTCHHIAFDMTSEETYYAAARSLVGHLMEHIDRDDPVDAVMCISDAFCFPVITALRDYLEVIPNSDVLVTGYDNYWRDSHLIMWEKTPPAVTVDKLNFELGKELAAIARERDGAGLSTPPGHHMMKPKLIRTDQS